MVTETCDTITRFRSKFAVTCALTIRSPRVRFLAMSDTYDSDEKIGLDIEPEEAWRKLLVADEEEDESVEDDDS